MDTLSSLPSHLIPEQRAAIPRLRIGGSLLAVAALAFLIPACRSARAAPSPTPATRQIIPLSRPRQDGDVSLEAAIARRRSVRSFTDQTLTLEQLSQLLWAAQGVTDPRGFRAAPSAGALYPLELYVATPNGFFHYLPERHALEQLSSADLRPVVWEHGLKQDALRAAPVVLLICAVYARTEAKYGQRATRYVHIEAGHAAQNLLLQAVALGLGGVPIGAFYDDSLQVALALPKDHAPLYLLAVGYPDDSTP